VTVALRNGPKADAIDRHLATADSGSKAFETSIQAQTFPVCVI